MNNPEMSIVTVNWNGWKDTIECLESLYRGTHEDFKVIVVDNGSNDGSIEELKKWADGKSRVQSRFFNCDSKIWPIEYIECTAAELWNGGSTGTAEPAEKNKRGKTLFLMKSDKNHGFPEGCNIGIRFALSHFDPKYILIMNNDVVVSPTFIENLVIPMERDSSIGMASPKINWYDNPNLIWWGGCKINWWTGKIRTRCGEIDALEKQNTQVDGVTGCCMIIRSKLFHEIGFLDPAYFISGYDTYEYSYRAAKKRYKLIYNPSSRIWHKYSKSAQKMPPTYHIINPIVHTIRFYSTCANFYQLPSILLFQLFRLLAVRFRFIVSFIYSRKSRDKLISILRSLRK